MSRELLDRIQELETENEELKQAVEDWQSNLRSLREDFRRARDDIEYDYKRIERTLENLL